MVKHYIIMSSSYTDGSRVALDITEDCFLNSKAIAEMIEEIRKTAAKMFLYQRISSKQNPLHGILL